MRSKYYYLVAGLPDLSLDDSKLNYTVADFKTEIYGQLSEADRKLVDLFYLKFDNANLLKLLKDKDAAIDPRGNHSADELLDGVAAVRDEDTKPSRSLPPYMLRFIAEHTDEANESNVLPEDRLAGLYYEYAMKCGNAFVASWFEFNLNLNNILVALTARKFKADVAASVVGQGEVSTALRTSNARDFGLTGEVEYLEALVKASEIADLAEREKRLDALRWNWIEEATFFDYFDVELVFAFLLKSEMIERWLSLDKEKGNQLFRGIIDGLRNEVSIPAEFLK